VRHGNSHATIEPYRALEASDGGFLLAVGTDRQFEILCEKVIGGRTSLRTPLRHERGTRLEPRGARPILEEVFKAGTRETWLARCKAFWHSAGPVAGVLEAIRSPQADALARPRDDAEGRTVPTIRPPFFLPDFGEPAPAAPPRLGEDTDRLFAEVGLAEPSR